MTTAHDPSVNSEITFAQSEMVKAGTRTGPRIFSTGTILYGADGDFKAEINSLEDAKSALRRTKAFGAFSVKSLYVVDLKSGKEYPEHKDQLQLYSVIGLLRYPQVQEVRASALYLCGAGEVTTYYREQVEGLKMFWKNRALIQLNADSYPATPSPTACRWCQYAKSKAGPCEHG